MLFSAVVKKAFTIYFSILNLLPQDGVHPAVDGDKHNAEKALKQHCKTLFRECNF